MPIESPRDLVHVEWPGSVRCQIDQGDLVAVAAIGFDGDQIVRSGKSFRTVINISQAGIEALYNPRGPVPLNGPYFEHGIPTDLVSGRYDDFLVVVKEERQFGICIDTWNVADQRAVRPVDQDVVTEEPDDGDLFSGGRDGDRLSLAQGREARALDIARVVANHRHGGLSREELGGG